MAISQILAALAFVFVSSMAAFAQDPSPSPTPVITARTSLVLVPALVRTKSGALVYTLTANDFSIKDNGIEQKLRLEEDTGEQPLALVVAVQTGGAGGRELDLYRTLPAMLDSIVGNVPHKVAVVAFDSRPALVQKFTMHMDRVATTLDNLDPGDDKAATLDALAFSVAMLGRQPAQYRRAVLLISETLDHGSQGKLGDALREISDTNTVIYSVAFSSSKAEAKHEASKLPVPGGSVYSDTPGPPNGCMGKYPDADANVTESQFTKFFDCMGLLIPPLHIAKMAVLVGINGFRQNLPETVAHLTGGEYFKFNNVKSLEQDLATISNHIPNRYVLSFHPQSPEPGIHALEVSLKDYPDLKLTARSSYWMDDEASAPPKP